TKRGGTLLAGELASTAGPDSLAAAVADPAQGLFVGVLSDVAVGYARASCQPLAGGRLLGVLDELFVEPAARGVGVGEALAAAVVGWLDQKGCLGVDTRALPGDRATKNFLEGAGFSARLLVMHRALPGPRGRPS
ncbi:MAG: GNAT family N-acetyltransferase, partial [Acidimicrobiales bacterium]|nr:GNAT family N-acetyltransferase [Acidimicrobiales bacterium]